MIIYRQVAPASGAGAHARRRQTDNSNPKEIEMHRLLCRTLSGFALLGIMCGSPARAEECSGTITADELTSAEDARYAAQTGDDFPALERLIGEDLVYIHSSALVDSKTSYIDAQRAGTVKYRKMRRSDVTLRTYGCVGVITGLGNFDVTVKGQDLAVEIRFHSIWAKRASGLQFVSWEATRTPKQ
jgi:Domain of unknown function (DUF4440)